MNLLHFNICSKKKRKKIPTNPVFNCLFLLTFVIKAKYFLLAPEFSHFPSALAFKSCLGWTLPGESQVVTTTIRAFSWPGVPVWMNGRRRQPLLRLFIHHSSVPCFPSLKMPLNSNIFSHLCTDENPGVNGAAPHRPRPAPASSGFSWDICSPPARTHRAKDKNHLSAFY